MDVLCSNIFLKFSNQEKTNNSIHSQKNLSPLIQSKKRALTLADKSGNETHK